MRVKKIFDGKTVEKTWGNLFASAYLLLMFGVYPFYMKQGYVDIGEAKYRFFMYCSLAAAGILGVVGIVRGIWTLLWRTRQREPYLIRWENLSATDIFVILYATELFLSYVLSDYKEEALWGTEGWHIGLVPLLILCGLYFCVSRFWDGKACVWYVGMAASAVVFLLGILDRFSLHLIPLEIRQPAFISTLGNINWFCGYLSVLAPVGACLFLYACNEPEKKGKRLLAGGYTFIAFTAGFCQGSSSIFLFFGALFYILLWIAVKKRNWLRAYFFLVILWGMSAQLVRALRLWLPEHYNYDTDNLCGILTDSNITLFAALVALLFFLILNERNFNQEEISKSVVKTVHRLMGYGLAAGIFLWFSFSCFYTWRGNYFLSQNDLFLFNKDWGNGRGAAIKAAFEMYKNMTPVEKLFGVGPDCFSAYAYSLPEVAQELRSSFGSDRLTNAHNELLTGLVNTGMAGVLLYLGIFASFAARYIKKGLSFAGCVAVVSIFCYLFHNLVSFAQVLNLPFVFLILSMGERRSFE